MASLLERTDTPLSWAVWEDFRDEFGSARREPSSSRHWDRALEKLQEIRRYENDWDGEGAAAPPKQAVDLALRIALAWRAKGLPAPHGVAPSCDGTVVFEWRYPGEMREVEVEGGSVRESLVRGRNSTTRRIYSIG